jgi:hypothetical protein
MRALNVDSFRVETPTKFPPFTIERRGSQVITGMGNCVGNSGMNDVWRSGTYW